MEETFRIKAIVLRRRPFHEFDSKITVYSRERGKLDLVARGTTKPKSKLAGHIEPINLVNLMVVRGRQYDYAGTVLAENAFLEIKKSLAKTQTIGETINIFNKLVKEGEADETLFFLLHDFFTIINSGLVAEENLEFFQHLFLYKLFVHLGYRPELDFCVNCGQPISKDKNSFDFLRGGINCCQTAKDGLTISLNCVKMLQLAKNNDFIFFANIEYNFSEIEEVIKITRSLHNFNFSELSLK